jgi:hypothetical protein
MEIQMKHNNIIEGVIEDKCHFFRTFQIWPLESKFDPKGWLENFTDNELPYALHMLDSFLYYPEIFVDQLLIASFQKLCKIISDYPKGRYDWDTFLNQCIISWVPGERPNPTDSGHVFARKARQILNIPEENIMHPLDIIKNDIQRPIILLDDFVGSGAQCRDFWRGTSLNCNGNSIKSIAKNSKLNVYYCPLICNELGLNEIKKECKELTLSPVHVLDARYNLLNPKAWPDELRSGAIEFIRTKSLGLNDITDSNGEYVENQTDWRGFGKQGLAFGFYYGPPDATLPIFYSKANNWIPLIKRS